MSTITVNDVIGMYLRCREKPCPWYITWMLNGLGMKAFTNPITQIYYILGKYKKTLTPSKLLLLSLHECGHLCQRTEKGLWRHIWEYYGDFFRGLVKYIPQEGIRKGFRTAYLNIRMEKQAREMERSAYRYYVQYYYF